MPNIGQTESDSKPGLALKGFGMDCVNCAHLNEVDLTVKYFKIAQIEITQEEFEKK
jgi:hypothetical protein